MSHRLEITIFGTCHHVGAIYLTPKCIRAGVRVYGQKAWHAILSDIALGVGKKTLAKEVGHTIGFDVKPLYSAVGIAMQRNSFGMECFYGGNFMPTEAVDAQKQTLQPGDLMQGYTSGDMLGVFRAQRELAMFYRWDDVKEFNQKDITLVYDNLTPLLAMRHPFDLALDITWKGKSGRRTRRDTHGELTSRQHVFHKAQ